MVRAVLWPLILSSLLVTGCATDVAALASASPSPASTPRLRGIATFRWSGGASIDLALLKLQSLSARPGAMLKVRIERAAASIGQHAHDAGFVYTLSGTQRVVFADRAVDVEPGKATLVALPAFTHQHGAGPGATWLFISIGDTDRAASSGTHGPVVYESAALAPLATGSHPGGFTFGYTETLRRLELDPGARSLLHSQSGYEAIYVLDGTIDVRSQGRSTEVRSGAAYVIAPGQAIQFVNTTAEPVRALLFFITPGGEPFEVDLPG